MEGNRRTKPSSSIQTSDIKLRRADRGFRAVPRLLVDTGGAWVANLNVGAMFRSFSGGPASLHGGWGVTPSLTGMEGTDPVPADWPSLLHL